MGGLDTLAYLSAMYEALLALLRPRTKVCLWVLAPWASQVSGKDCNDSDHGKTPSLSYNTTKNARVKVSVCILCYSVGSKSTIHSALRSERLLVF